MLTPLDIFSTLFAAFCHDYQHDGFNNGYHVATKSERFRLYGADGVQEKYHFAESWKVVERNKMLQHLSQSEQALFKQRMQSCILATDMAKHMGDLNEVKNILAEHVAGGKRLVDPEVMDEQALVKRQQTFLDLAVHASDISFLARSTSV